uniref:Uncharacterized protein n=1 Tax=Cacopsylla melanoneura TaxID=428564 RepID=A0A8D8S2E9_9HEMI
MRSSELASHEFPSTKRTCSQFFFPLPIVDRPYGRRTNTTLVKCSRNRSSTEEDCIVHAVYDDSEKVLELNDENYTLQTTRKNVYQDCHSVFEKCIGRLKSIHRLEVTSSATTIMMKTYDRSFETLLLAFGTACPHMDVILHKVYFAHKARSRDAPKCITWDYRRFLLKEFYRNSFSSGVVMPLNGPLHWDLFSNFEFDQVTQLSNLYNTTGTTIDGPQSSVVDDNEEEEEEQFVQILPSIKFVDKSLVPTPLYSTSSVSNWTVRMAHNMTVLFNKNHAEARLSAIAMESNDSIDDYKVPFYWTARHDHE